MVALYRSGREADALDSYARYRTWLTADFGIEPGPELQRIHRQVLAHACELAPRQIITFARPVSSPHQLPPDLLDFCGRRHDVGEISRVLTGSKQVVGPVIAAITGAPGIGKTAVAIHIGHALRERFPDGQFYVSLGGTSEIPRDPSDVLAEMLSGLGVGPDRIPATLEQRAALFRMRTAGKRVLLIADDAASSAQIRPLIPSTPRGAVLVTSRLSLAGFAAAKILKLDPLAHPEAVSLLREIVGADRVAEEPEATNALADACDGFPLALRIAGTRLASRPCWTIGALAAKLGDQRAVLHHLTFGDLTIRDSIRCSYRKLDKQSRQAFVMLAKIPDREISVAQAAACLKESPQCAESLLERLVDASMMEVGAIGCYRFYALLRSYAIEQLA
jgi:predicted ATPase